MININIPIARSHGSAGIIAYGDIEDAADVIGQRTRTDGYIAHAGSVTNESLKTVGHISVASRIL